MKNRPKSTQKITLADNEYCSIFLPDGREVSIGVTNLECGQLSELDIMLPRRMHVNCFGEGLELAKAIGVPNVLSSKQLIIPLEEEPTIIGTRMKFTYPDFGTPRSVEGYYEHSGQEVLVVRQLVKGECDDECQPMFSIRADDGWDGACHINELS